MVTQSGRLATLRDKIKLLDIGYLNAYGYKMLQGGYIHPGVPFHKIKKSLGYKVLPGHLKLKKLYLYYHNAYGH